MLVERDIYIPGLNLVSRERLDPLVMFIADLLVFEPSRGGYFFAQGLILLLGMYWLLGLLGLGESSQRTARLAGSASVAISICFLLGFEPVFLKIHWLPAVLAGAVSAAIGRTLTSWLFFLTLLFLWVLSAGPLSFLGLLFVVLTLLMFSDSSDRKSLRVVVLFCLFFGVIGTLTIPAYQSPPYPGFARLVPISPLQLYPQPLIGPVIEPNPILYDAYLQVLGDLTTRFAVLGFFLLLLAGLFLSYKVSASSDKKPALRRIVFLAVLAVIVMLIASTELFVPAEAGAYAPFPALARIIPGLGLLPLPWLILPFGLIAAYLLAARGAAAHFHFGMLVATLSTLGYYSVFGNLISPGGQSDFPRSCPRSAEPSAESISCSPSGYLVSVYGDWIAEPEVGQQRDFSNLVRLKRGIDFDLKVSADPLPREAAAAVDLDPHTRWRTGRPQRAGDYFFIEFSKPQEIVRIVLSILINPSDFPRGIRVEGGLDLGEMKTIIEQADWRGPLYWTELGYPFLGPQSEVILDFPQSETLRYLKFTQTSIDPHFDWSINEVKLFKLANQ